MGDKLIIMRMVAWIAGYCIAYSLGMPAKDAVDAAFLADRSFKEHFKIYNQ